MGMGKVRTYGYFSNKYLYYRAWYVALHQVQRDDFIGRWVLGRIIIFDGILKDMDAEVGIQRGFKMTVCQ